MAASDQLDRPRDRVPRLLMALVGLLLLRQVGWLLWGELNIDELENLQVLWLWERDVLPFRDYLHSHLPVFSFLLYPLYRLIGPDIALPMVVRLVFFPAQLLILWQLHTLGTRLTGRRLGGWLAMGFALTSPIVAESLSEVRGDTLVYPMTLGAVFCLWRMVREGEGQLRWFFLAGLLLGLSLLMTQKAVLVAAVIALGFERHLAEGLRLSFGKRLRAWVVFALLVVGPFVAALALLALTGKVDPAYVVALPDNGVRYAISEILTRYRFVLLLTTLIPAATIIGPALRTARRTLRIKPSGSSPAQLVMWVCAVYALLAVVQLLLMTVMFMHIFIFPFLFFSLLAARFFVGRRPRTVLVVFVLGLLLTHVQVWNGELYRSRAAQVAQFEYLDKNVPRNEPVLDSLLGVGAFRPVVGRHLHYRSAFFAPTFYNEQDVVVARALAKREYGAVVDQVMFRLYARPSIRKIIDLNYVPAPGLPDVLVRRPNPDDPLTASDPTH